MTTMFRDEIADSLQMLTITAPFGDRYQIRLALADRLDELGRPLMARVRRKLAAIMWSQRCHCDRKVHIRVTEQMYPTFRLRAGTLLPAVLLDISWEGDTSLCHLYTDPFPDHSEGLKVSVRMANIVELETHPLAHVVDA